MDRPTSTPLTQAQFDACIVAERMTEKTVGQHIVWAPSTTQFEASTCDFIGVNFRDAQLHEAHFVDCLFVHCNFRSADLRDSVFERCRFYDGSDDSPCDFSYATLRQVRFEGCDLTTAVCCSARAFGVELRRCQAAGIDFSKTDFGLGGGDVVAATFVDNNLAYADFSRTRLDGADFTGNRLSHSIWHDASLADADLSGSELNNIEARGLVLRGADLRGAQFNQLDPRQIDLTDTHMNIEQGLQILRALEIHID